ncbi:Altered inheritance of mitochondria protein 6 [Ciborinia camelliae]|nr:Altered inheritance of mitochondria protein 6 [Ciborinia camelliae]
MAPPSKSKSDSQSGIQKIISSRSSSSTHSSTSHSGPYWHPNFTTSITPINCWSHNDEHQPIPLYTALAAGCIAIEADCFTSSHYPSSWIPFSRAPKISENDLLVGHATSELHPSRTLSALYLNPLLEILTQQNLAAGNPAKKVGVWNENPHLSLHLTIDYKTVSSGHDGIPILYSLLEPLRAAGFLTYYDTRTEKLVPGPITIVGTGDADFDLICTYERVSIFKDARFFQFLDSHNPSNSLSDQGTD